MKQTTKNEIRGKVARQFMEFAEGLGEDVGMIASNSFNYPIEHEGEEAWIEVRITIPNHDEGYEKRNEYEDKLEEKEEKEKERLEKKKKKIKADKEKREKKKKKEIEEEVVEEVVEEVEEEVEE